MVLGIAGRRALLVAGESDVTAACRRALQSEGVNCADVLGDAQAAPIDVVVVVAPLRRRQTSASTCAEELEHAWEFIPWVASLYAAALPGMKSRHWGRLVFVGSSVAKEIGQSGDPMNASVGLGMLGLQKSLAGEYGDHGITCNSVLWDADALIGDQRGETLAGIGAAVAFLASQGAAYLTGVAIGIDRAQSGGMF